MIRPLIVLALLGSAARANDHAAQIKALLTAQAKAQVAGDRDAFVATLTSDAIGSYKGQQPEDQFGLLGDSGITVNKWVITASQSGWAGTWGWVVGDAQITTTWYAEPEGAGDPNPRPQAATYHFVELVVAEGTTVKAKAFELIPATPDKDLRHYNFIDELVPQTVSPKLAVLTAPGAHLSTDPATSVVGTSPSDRGLGLAAARKLVGGWKKLTLEIAVGKDQTSDSYKPFEKTVGDATLVWAQMRMKIRGTWYRVRGFGILRGDQLVALGYGADI